jgi:hypothetical protein
MQRFLYVVSQGSQKYYKYEQVAEATREVAFFVLVRCLFWWLFRSRVAKYFCRPHP